MPENKHRSSSEIVKNASDGLIQKSRVYWDWFGIGVLKRNEYHK